MEKLRALSYREFIAAAEKEPRGYLVEHLLPESGIVLLVGAPYSGKTSFLVTLISAMSGVGTLAGLKVKQGTVLYCTLEHRLRSLSTLLQAGAKWAHQQELKVHLMCAPLDLDDEDHLAAIAAEAQRINASLIVIDSLRRASKFDENNAQDVSEVARRLAHLSNKNQRAVVAIHHTSKVGDVRGSTDLLAMSDSFLKLSRTGEIIRIDAKHHDNEPYTLKIRLAIEGGDLHCEFVGASSSHTHEAKLEAAIFKLCSTGIQRMRGIRDGIRAAGISASHEDITKAIEELSKNGQIKNLGSKTKHQWTAVRRKNSKQSPPTTQK